MSDVLLTPEDRRYSMPTAAGKNAGMSAEDGGALLAVSLDSAQALDAHAVGDGASLLAAAGVLGLPVVSGVAVTTAGIAAENPLTALRLAWTHIRGYVRIVLTECGAPGGQASGSVTCDATTWMGLLDGVYDVLAHDRLENPNRRAHDWAMLFLRLPADAHSVLMEARPGKRLTLWTPPDQPSLTRRNRRQLRGLAKRTVACLGHPLSIEAITTGDGDWTIVDLRYQEPLSLIGSLP